MKNVASSNKTLVEDGYRLSTIHKVEGHEMYISTKDNILVYIDNANNSITGEMTFGSNIVSTATIGKILIVTCSEGIEYARLSGDEYINIGGQIPELALSFGLIREQKESDIETYTTSIDNIENDVKSTVYPKISAFVGEVKKDSFVSPFFVRYAYQLYDSSYIYHSAPILMPCATQYDAIWEFDVQEVNTSKGTISYKGFAKCFAHQLAYKVVNYDTISELAKYGDIIRSIDIFVSLPINLSGSEEDLKMHNDGDGLESYSISSENVNAEFGMVTLNTSVYDDAYTFERDREKVKSDIQECSQFRLLKSIPIHELKDKMTIIDIDEGYLETLSEKKKLDDDFNTHNKVISNGATVYNNRVHLHGVSEELFKGYNIFSMLPRYTESENYRAVGSSVYVYIEKDDRTIVVKGDAVGSGDDFKLYLGQPVLYLYYPNPNAKKVVYRINDNYYDIPLTRHPMLNGAYAFANFESLLEDSTKTAPSNANKDITSRNDNCIYVSSVNNPFYFPASNVVSVSNGVIMDLATSAKALSEGQFGQFPLYVFCTDGIWALEVAKDGSYSAKQPISRDVCNNADSITQIDGAVVFTTDQGLKMIQGSEVVLLSGHLEGNNVNEEDYFNEANGKKFFERYGMAEFDTLVNPETRDIRDILRTCRIAYDYTNQLLRIFPKREEGVAETPYKYYVYSFTTQEFATVIGNEFDNGDGTFNEVTTVVHDYPSSVIQIGGSLYRPMETEREGFHEGLLLTRPLLFDEPFALKKLQDMRLQYSKFYKDNEGNSSKCHVIVYVSNDGKSWAMLKSLRGGSFKYFRIAVVTKLSDADALTGAIVRYELNRTNKLR